MYMHICIDWHNIVNHARAPQTLKTLYKLNYSLLSLDILTKSIKQSAVTYDYETTKLSKRYLSLLQISVQELDVIPPTHLNRMNHKQQIFEHANWTPSLTGRKEQKHMQIDQ
jgi:hypothetical protein